MKTLFSAALLALLPLSVMAAGTGHSHSHATPKVDRDIVVTIGDNFYEPAKFDIRPGETIRFKITNKGQLLHEFAIGSTDPKKLAEHQAMMQMMLDHGMITPTRIDPDKMKMDHGGHGHHAHVHDGSAGSLLLEPSQSGEVIWTFKPGQTVEVQCTIPGHYESGMQAPITLK